MENINGQTMMNGKGNISQDDRVMKNGNCGSNSSSPSSMPHMPYEKSKMIDITRDKPIKISVRVVVPTKDHPKFNFVGKLLGPKGNSLKRLQEETMCKMSVLGRGSMRDRKKEEELRLSGEYKYSHLSEDLHVEIQTFAPPAEAHARIAYALAEVRRFLVPDHHDDIRQEQKWEMQALNSSQNSNNSINTDECHQEQQICSNGNSSDATSSSCDISTSSNSGGGGGSGILGVGGVENTASNCGGNHVENNVVVNNQQHINNNTIAINNNNCDTIKNNNQVVVTAPPIIPQQQQITTTTTVTPIEVVNDVEVAPALALIDQQNALLRGVNIAGTLGRKRPLLCSRNINNPTKRTVFSLLARAKTANALHGFHPNGPSICDSLQILTTSPLIIPPATIEHVIQAGAVPANLQNQTSNSNAQSIKQENLLQGA